MLKKFLLSIFVVIISTGEAGATPTGLNNISTTDVVPKEVLVVQFWTNFGNRQTPSHYSGFKYGPGEKIEIGMDSKVSGSAGPLTFQFKYRIGETDFGLAGLAGAENISESDERAGRINPYLSFSQELGFFRLHLGANLQNNNEAIFTGIDRAIKFQDRDLILRGDLKQVNNGDDLLGSLGFLHKLPGNFILEGWISLPSDSGEKETFTLKLNYVF